jgi:hypothetical protein
MFSKLHDRLGTAGLIVAIVALVAAMTGGAYAASTGLSGKEKKEVTKIAKQYAGKPGKQGKQGPAGTAGLPGPAGPAGPKGSDGNRGETGPEGPQGREGPEGSEGSPWTAGGTLPAGATETGQWGALISPNRESEVGKQFFPISFTLSVATVPEPIYVGPTETSKAGCPGRGEPEENGIPEAESGKLCVYAAPVSEQASFLGFQTYWEEEEDFFVLKSGASPSGTIVEVRCESKFCTMFGSWAVTAPAA